MNLKDWKWQHESSCEATETGVNIFAPGITDYFVNPADGNVIANAPFLYQEVAGDFVLRAKVRHDFASTFDACVLLAKGSDTLWAKACFEYSDFDTHAVVSVMTNGLSDDANGVNIDGKEVWLQLARKGQLFAVHYSLDGKTFRMVRLANLPMGETCMVGLEAQSPCGQGGMRYFENVQLLKTSLEDIRNGNINN